MPTLKLSPRSLLLTTAAASALMVTAPHAIAQDDSPFSLSANAALVSDYRFRGISLSNKDIAIQGGFDLSTDSGFYVGTWGSSIEQYAGSELELDVYAGYATSFNELSFDVGILAYTYPGSDDTTYWEAYSSIGGNAGPVGWTFGGAYAFDQDSIGGQDNIYVYLDTSTALGEGPMSLSTHLAIEDGAFSFGKTKWDWSIGLNYAFEQFSLGVAYVDTNIDTSTGKGTVVASLSASF